MNPSDSAHARRVSNEKRGAPTAGPSSAATSRSPPGRVLVSAFRDSTIPMDEISASEAAYRYMVEKRKREMAPKKRAAPIVTAGPSSAPAPSHRVQLPTADYGYPPLSPYDENNTSSSRYNEPRTGPSPDSSTPSFNNQEEADTYEKLTGKKVPVHKRHGERKQSKTPSPPMTWESFQQQRRGDPEPTTQPPAAGPGPYIHVMDSAQFFHPSFVGRTEGLMANASDFPVPTPQHARPTPGRGSVDPTDVNYASNNANTRIVTTQNAKPRAESNTPVPGNLKRRVTIEDAVEAAKEAAKAVGKAVHSVRRKASLVREKRRIEREHKEHEKTEFRAAREADHQAFYDHKAQERAAALEAETKRRAATLEAWGVGIEAMQNQRQENKAENARRLAESRARLAATALLRAAPEPARTPDTRPLFAGKPDNDAERKRDHVRQIDELNARDAQKASSSTYQVKKLASRFADIALDAVATKPEPEIQRKNSLIGFSDQAPPGAMMPCRTCGKEGQPLAFGKCPACNKSIESSQRPVNSIPPMPTFDSLTEDSDGSADSIPPMPTFGSSRDSVPIIETESWSEPAALDAIYHTDRNRPNRLNMPPAASSIYSQTTNQAGPSDIAKRIAADNTANPRIPGMSSSRYSQATIQRGPSAIARLVTADGAVVPRIPGTTTSVYSQATNTPGPTIRNPPNVTAPDPLAHLTNEHGPLRIVKTGTTVEYANERADLVLPTLSELRAHKVGDAIDKGGKNIWKIVEEPECECNSRECNLAHRSRVITRDPRKAAGSSQRRRRSRSPLMALPENDAATDFEVFDSFNRAERHTLVKAGKARVIEGSDSRSGSRSRRDTDATDRYEGDDSDRHAAIRRKAVGGDTMYNELVDQVAHFTTTHKLAPAALTHASVTKHTSAAAFRNSVAMSVFSGVSSKRASDDGSAAAKVSTEAYDELMEVLRKFSQKHGLPDTDEAGVWPERPRIESPDTDRRRDTSTRLQEFPPRC